MNRGPSQEYLLQGSVLDDSLEILLHRLRSMSDNSEEGLTRFKQHEVIYTMREGGTSNGFVSVRVRRPLNAPDQPFQLCYLGNPELGDKSRLTTVRTCIEVNCTPNVAAFLQDLGFIIEYELVSHGWQFKKNRLKATVSKIHRMLSPPNTDQLMPLSKSHFVEVSLISSSANEQAASEVHQFSELLKPLVNLEKLDPRRLGTI